MLQMRVLQNQFNKTNVYFVTRMQVFHIEVLMFLKFLCFWSSFSVIM